MHEDLPSVDRQERVTDELRAMMRDVPISPRLLKVLEDLDDETPGDPD